MVPPFRPLELYDEGITTLSDMAYNYIFRFPALIHDLMVYHHGSPSMSETVWLGSRCDHLRYRQECGLLFDGVGIHYLAYYQHL